MLPTIRYEAIGDIVKVAQYMTGFATIKQASDFFGDAFSAHVMEWQARNGLAADGVIGKNTWTKIANIAPMCSTSKNKTSPYTCAIQILLGGLVVDGIYGQNTKKAVAAYQSANGLSADGICGPITWGCLITGDNTSGGSGSGGFDNKQPIDYKQYDSRWSKIKYSTHTASQTIGNSGCGTTSMADIVATWWDSNVTPVEMSDLSVKNGYRTYDSGTAWGFFEFCAKKYGAFKFIQTTSIATLQSALAQGAYAVVSFGPSKWTSGGHYCCIWKWDGKYFYINDPASSSSSRAKGTESEVKAARKQFFIFYKEDPDKKEEPVEEKPIETKKEETPTQISNPTVKGSAIIDISKCQGTINFDVLKTCVSFIIARASCGSDKDVKFDEYAKEMVKRGIPFGVYCYSYAGTIEKAVDEAQKIIKYARQYSPLFYVMDAEESKLSKDTIAAFAKELRKQGAERIGCYVANHHYNDYKYDSIRDLFDFTWIPKYGSNDGTIAGASKPTYKCDLWQYTSRGSIPGISGNVDINTITGDGKDLDWFLNKGDTEPTKAEDPSKDEGAEVEKKTVCIENGNVNVRTLPNTSGEIIGVAYNGSELEYGGSTADNGWLSVVYNGKNGWVSNKYGVLR